MTREDLINFNISQQWRKARIEFCEEQIKTIGRLTSVLNDMPKGSRKVYDNEAESLSKLIDQIRELEKEIKGIIVEQENKINEQLQKLEPKYGLILYNHYILGNSIKYIAREVMHNEIKYTYTLRDKALDKFDQLNHEKKE
jgi:phospho-2-dehydro-3-deoxyheptonate aldolase